MILSLDSLNIYSRCLYYFFSITPEFLSCERERVKDLAILQGSLPIPEMIGFKGISGL